MYLEYFGFDRFPFTIAPDPDFLFPSAGHQEALAHLQYALTGLGGLICLTGEVGTGKTTLCRSFLAGLDDSVRTAYIFNPQLSPAELLQSICDDLDIVYGDSDSLRDLYRYLNEFLIAEYAEGRKVICVIDEAQAMPPELLEQVRLLTNLETHTEKLMTVILVGQPELQQTLARYDLRQLNQRITARYHLRNLSLGEVREYVSFRLVRAGRPDDSSASSRDRLFTDGALRRLWQASGGVPRMINTLADRALLGAYAREKTRVTTALIKGAEKEILPPKISADIAPAAGRSNRGIATLFRPGAVLLLLVVIAGGVFFTLSDKSLTSSGIRQLAAHYLHTEPENPVTVLSTEAFGQPLEQCAQLSGTDYRCLWVDWPLSQLYVGDYLQLIQVRDFNGNSRWQREKPQAPDKYNGQALIFWQPPQGFDADHLIKPGERSTVVGWVRQKLGGSWDHDWQVIGPAGDGQAADSDFYDPLLANKVEQFQRANGLLADRILGPQTLYYLQQAGG